MLSSDQLVAFVAVMRAGNTVEASRRLLVDHSTVARRISALEATLGARLFDRSPRGFAPTEAAARLMVQAERVESALLAAAESVATSSAEISGIVRLATPEIFGTAVVAPNLADLLTQHPNLLLELSPESRSISLSRREADIAVMVRRPPRGRLITRRLADYRIGLYAARDYVERHPAIRRVEDLAQHLFVSFIDELVPFPELLALNQLVPTARIAFRSSSSMAQQTAVTKGLGIGALHALVAERDAGLVRILPELEVQRSYWLVVHADLQRVAAIRRVIDFLHEVTGRHAGLL